MSSPIEVVSLGRFARAVLSSGNARVIAVFERSCYVEAPAGLACLGVVGNGPLNAHCASLPASLAVGHTPAIDFGSAAAQAVGSVNASHLVCARDLGEMCGWP